MPEARHLQSDLRCDARLWHHPCDEGRIQYTGWIDWRLGHVSGGDRVGRWLYQLQGRLASNPVPASWVGSQVTLTCVASSACDGFVPVPYSMTTDASGHYQWLKTATPGSGVVLGTYRVTVQRRAYLGATKAGDVTIGAGSNTINLVTAAPTLLGGDVLVNSIIDIFDLTALGNSFGTPAIPADSGNDVNGDGFVNVFDLTIAGGNYEKTTSVWAP